LLVLVLLVAGRGPGLLGALLLRTPLGLVLVVALGLAGLPLLLLLPVQLLPHLLGLLLEVLLPLLLLLGLLRRILLLVFLRLGGFLIAPLLVLVRLLLVLLQLLLGLLPLALLALLVAVRLDDRHLELVAAADVAARLRVVAVIDRLQPVFQLHARGQ